MISVEVDHLENHAYKIVRYVCIRIKHVRFKMDRVFVYLDILVFFVKRFARKEVMVMNVVNNATVHQWADNVIMNQASVFVIQDGKHQHVRKFARRENMVLNVNNIVNVKMMPLVVQRTEFVFVEMALWERCVRKFVQMVSTAIIA